MPIAQANDVSSWSGKHLPRKAQRTVVHAIAERALERGQIVRLMGGAITFEFPGLPWSHRWLVITGPERCVYVSFGMLRRLPPFDRRWVRREMKICGLLPRIADEPFVRLTLAKLTRDLHLRTLLRAVEVLADAADEALPGPTLEASEAPPEAPSAQVPEAAPAPADPHTDSSQTSMTPEPSAPATGEGEGEVLDLEELLSEA